MSRYDEILKRNEQLIDNVYEMNEEITELANENECLTRENDVLYDDNVNLNEHNAELKKGIADLHKNSVKRGGRREYRVQPQYQQPIQPQPQPQYQQPIQPQYQQVEVKDESKIHRTAISVFMSEKAKNTSIFCVLIFLILLLGLGIEPGVALTYESLLDCYLELVFNLYNLCILGAIGFLLRKLWKKLNK